MHNKKFKNIYLAINYYFEKDEERLEHKNLNEKNIKI